MSESVQNSGFLVTARKWRPLRYTDVVGQDHITTTLQNSLKTGRIHHAYLFCGPRGVGKTTTARIHARALNCLNLKVWEPCNECINCTAMIENRSMDIIEIDGASNNSVDDVRKLRENAKYAPSNGKYKMYIIDEVHMLSNSAFNALLKILEEPPPHLLFVFATTEAHKVPATIISRCQKFDFRRMEISSITSQLKYIAEKENVTIDEESLLTIAKKGDGSMRDSQSIFDQVLAFCGNEIHYKQLADSLNLIDEDFYFRISDSLLNHNTPDVFQIAAELTNRGYDIIECLTGMLEHYRNILTVKITDNINLLETSEIYKQKYQATSQKYSKQDLLNISSHLGSGIKDIKFASQPKIRFELLLAQLSEMPSGIEISELLSEIRQLKSSGIALSQENFNQNLSEKKNSNDLIFEPKSEIKAKVSESKADKYGDLPAFIIPKINHNPAIEQSIKTGVDLPDFLKPLNLNNIGNAPSLVNEGNQIRPKTDEKNYTSEEIESKWNEFLQHLSSKEEDLDSLSSAYIRFDHNQIHCYFTSNFIFDRINNNLSRLNYYGKDFFSGKMLINAYKAHESDMPEDAIVRNFKIIRDERVNTQAPKQNMNQKNNGLKRERLPIEELLVEKFNAYFISEET